MPNLDTDHRAWSVPDNGIDVRSHASEQLVYYATANHDKIATTCFGDPVDHMRHLAAFHHYLQTCSGLLLQLPEFLARHIEQRSLESPVLGSKRARNLHSGNGVQQL
jgi:hypothetical protein